MNFSFGILQKLDDLLFFWVVVVSLQVVVGLLDELWDRDDLMTLMMVVDACKTTFPLLRTVGMKANEQNLL